MSTNLTDAHFEQSSLTNAIIASSNLTGANLRGVNLIDAYLADSTLVDADLTAASVQAQCLATRLGGDSPRNSCILRPVINSRIFEESDSIGKI